jgi:hypothetical protein
MKFIKKYLKNLKQDQSGNLLLLALVFGSLAMTIIILGVASYGIFEHKASNRKHDRDMAFHIAEAGINYYRWHLAHNPTDYTNDLGQHEYRDKDNNLIGYYNLEIDEPLPGSTVVIVRSTGWTEWQPQSTRTIQIRIGFPALTDYVFLENDGMNFSFTTVVHGIIHSNGGIRFDGESDSWVRSAKDRYRYENQWHNGVWGGGGPKSFWQYPVAEIDFYSVTSDLATIRDMADEPEGLHLTSSGEYGWHIVFDNDSFDLYKVNTISCYHGEGRWRRRWWSGWYWDGDNYCYDIDTEEFVQTYDFPTNGALFVEDDVWVEGVVDGRLSVGVGEFPVQEPYHKIIIQDNLTYLEHSSDDVIGLMSQGEVIVPYEVPDDMYIDAAILSQFKKIYRPNYYDDEKNSLTIFGSQISYEGGGWKYGSYGHVTSGFVYTNHIYDGNLRYYPPPAFPVGNTYEMISWEELE